MAIKQKNEQVLTYLELGERLELDEAKDELGISRASLVRQCILEYLEKRRQGMELLHASGDFEVIGEVPPAVVAEMSRWGTSLG